MITEELSVCSGRNLIDAGHVGKTAFFKRNILIKALQSV